MNILFIGDVVGKSGRRALFSRLGYMRDRYEPELVVVNVENAAGGFGLTGEIMQDFLDHGADVLTSGNHIFDKKEILAVMEQEPRLLRPHNYPRNIPGSGWKTLTTLSGVNVGVLNIMGNVFMQPILDCPFECAQTALEKKPDNCNVVLVDFHAEASSEKVAMGWFLDGRVSAVLGTHTHVPTADERVLPEGTAYISDVGMTGCYDSVIGMNTDKVLKRFVEKVPERMEVATGPATVCGAVISVDSQTGKSTGIERIAVSET